MENPTFILSMNGAADSHKDLIKQIEQFLASLEEISHRHQMGDLTEEFKFSIEWRSKKGALPYAK